MKMPWDRCMLRSHEGFLAKDKAQSQAEGGRFNEQEERATMCDVRSPAQKSAAA